MWKQWSSSEITEEFSQIKKMGFECVRIFLLWEDFQPAEGEISLGAVSRFDELLAMAKAGGLTLAPTFFVGNMSGELWDVSWRKKRDVYEHPALLNSQVLLLRDFALRYDDEEGILFWDICNEPDLAFEASSVEVASKWNKLLFSELKKHDRLHPVTLGLHQGSLLTDNHFRPQELAPFNDFLCTHAYPIYTSVCPDSPDSLRTTYFASFLCRLSSALSGKPTMMEEFGLSSQLVSDERQRGYYESVVFSLLANEALGLFPWCFGDFSVSDRRPYDSTPYEAGFGLTSAEGTVKPSGQVVTKLAQLLGKVDFSLLESERPRTAILLPRRYHDNPDKEITPELYCRALFNSFVLAKQAGLEVELVTADEELDSYRLIFAPVIPRRGSLNTSDWKKLRQYVEEGGFLYASYHGVAAAELENIFGISPEFAVEVQVEGICLIGTEAMKLPAEVPLRSVPSKSLKVREEGSVWMRDDKGEASLIFHSLGKGGSFFCTYPIELYLSYMPQVYAGNQAYKIYEEMARVSGVSPNLASGLPQIELKEFSNDRCKYVLLINHEDKPVDVDWSTREEIRGLHDVLSEEVILSPYFSLRANEARFLKIVEEGS
jgi:beta-galactosidase